MDSRQQYPNYEYSTLEVVQQNHGEHGDAPQQQPDASQHGYAHGGYPEQAYQTDPRKYSPQPYEGHNLPQVVNPTYPEVAPKPDAPEVLESAPKGDYTGYQGYQDVQQPVPQAAERRIWGLKRKTFTLLAVISIVVVAAVVGGAVGGTVGKNGEKKSGSSTGGDSGGGNGNGGGGGGGVGGSSTGNTTTNNSPILADSNISAINWTDSNNVQYNAVFWQAKSNELMMSVWDTNTTTWDQVNITSKISSSLNITAMPGTPLAAAARGYPWTASKLQNVAGDFGIALFYLSAQSTILEVYSEDMTGASWQLGDLTTSRSSSIKAASNTQLGAWWSLCTQNCSGDILLVYEDDQQTLQLANSSDWSSTPLLRNIADGASLTITTFSGSSGTRDAVRVYYDSSDKLSELMWSPPGPWYYGSFPLFPASPRITLPADPSVAIPLVPSSALTRSL